VHAVASRDTLRYGEAMTSPEQPTPPEPAPAQRFDEILEELQRIVARLENEDLPLEQALAAFERGVTLSRSGQGILDAAERRVEVLLRDGSTEPLEK
jgi:exodeoxyribonuclease VII small subunit